MLALYVFEDVYYRTKLREDSEKWFERVIQLELQHSVLTERLTQHSGQVAAIEQRIEKRHQLVLHKLLRPPQHSASHVTDASPASLTQPLQPFKSEDLNLTVLRPEEKRAPFGDARRVVKKFFNLWRSSDWLLEYHSSGNAEREQKCFEQELVRAHSGTSAANSLVHLPPSTAQDAGRRAGVVVAVCAEVSGIAANLKWLHNLKATCQDINLYIYLKHCSFTASQLPEIRVPTHLAPCTRLFHVASTMSQFFGDFFSHLIQFYDHLEEQTLFIKHSLHGKGQDCLDVKGHLWI
ncbi:hypothetical protein CYMTET_29326 [Cymbomonas tetramitiformis]|uniref:Uncharacterized protein n=1 Tax=Cymbomonas tetramitiformis TaxID=36881 RepID=A0AAE0KV12_9CHLO|nr:hypothetical protein CYMTET_29326 [Cymbomonas tetramitiformis]